MKNCIKVFNIVILSVKYFMLFYKCITVSRDMQKISIYSKKLKISGCMNWNQNLESSRKTA